MSFWRWLAVVIRLAVETVLLGFTFHHAHLSVALTLTALTANAEWDQLMRHLRSRDEESFAEKLKRVRDLS